jgi:hypothetical protein
VQELLAFPSAEQKQAPAVLGYAVFSSVKYTARSSDVISGIRKLSDELN